MYFAFPNPVARTFPAQVSPGCGIGDQHRALCWEQAEPQSPGHWAHPLCPCSPASVTPSYPGTNKSINVFLLQEPKARDCWSPGQSGTSQNSPVQLFPEHPLGVNTQHRALAESSPCCFNTEYIFIFPLPKKSSEILLFLSFLFFTFFFPFSFFPPPFSFPWVQGLETSWWSSSEKDPQLPPWLSDIYWQLKNKIQIFPLLCSGAVGQTGGRVSLLLCSNSLLEKPPQSKVSDAGKVLFSSRAGSNPLWIKLLQGLLHKWNLRKPSSADSLKGGLIFWVSY